VLKGAWEEPVWDKEVEGEEEEDEEEEEEEEEKAGMLRDHRSASTEQVAVWSIQYTVSKSNKERCHVGWKRIESLFVRREEDGREKETDRDVIKICCSV
jgi:hypothetical protein